MVSQDQPTSTSDSKPSAKLADDQTNRLKLRAQQTETIDANSVAQNSDSAQTMSTRADDPKQVAELTTQEPAQTAEPSAGLSVEQTEKEAANSISLQKPSSQGSATSSTHSAKKPPRSFARLWRQLTFVPLKNRWLNQGAQERIEAAIRLAEENHFGEIVVVIEDTLPLWRSLRLDAHTRALEVFASQGVWDTERNSGVLIYLCLSEHALEILVDRGLNRTIDPKYWRAVCDKTLAGITRGEPVRALEFLIRHVGKALKLFDQSGTDPSGNELSNQVIVL